MTATVIHRVEDFRYYRLYGLIQTVADVTNQNDLYLHYTNMCLIISKICRENEIIYFMSCRDCVIFLINTFMELYIPLFTINIKYKYYTLNGVYRFQSNKNDSFSMWNVMIDKNTINTINKGDTLDYSLEFLPNGIKHPESVQFGVICTSDMLYTADKGTDIHSEWNNSFCKVFADMKCNNEISSEKLGIYLDREFDTRNVNFDVMYICYGKNTAFIKSVYGTIDLTGIFGKYKNIVHDSDREDPQVQMNDLLELKVTRAKIGNKVQLSWARNGIIERGGDWVNGNIDACAGTIPVDLDISTIWVYSIVKSDSTHTLYCQKFQIIGRPDNYPTYFDTE